MFIVHVYVNRSNSMTLPNSQMITLPKVGTFFVCVVNVSNPIQIFQLFLVISQGISGAQYWIEYDKVVHRTINFLKCVATQMSQLNKVVAGHTKLSWNSVWSFGDDDISWQDSNNNDDELKSHSQRVNNKIEKQVLDKHSLIESITINGATQMHMHMKKRYCSKSI